MVIEHSRQSRAGKKQSPNSFKLGLFFKNLWSRFVSVSSDSEKTLNQRIEEREQDILAQLDRLPVEVALGLSEVKQFLEPHRSQLLYRGLTPVGLFPASQTGCYDVFGNVWEWCDEWLPRITPPSRPSMEKDNFWLPAIVKGGPAGVYLDDVRIIIGGWFDPYTRLGAHPLLL